MLGFILGQSFITYGQSMKEKSYVGIGGKCI